MKSLLESILSSTGSGQTGFVRNYIESHMDDDEQEVFKRVKVSDKGDVLISSFQSCSFYPLLLKDVNASHLPISLSTIGVPVILDMEHLKSCENFPKSCYSYFWCFGNEIENYDYLPEIVRPGWGSTVMHIGGHHLKRITADYTGKALCGNGKIFIDFDSSNLTEDEQEQLLQDVKTHFENHTKVKGKYELFLQDLNPNRVRSSRTVYYFKHK